MILFVIIGAIFLRYLYTQVTPPPDVQAIVDQVVREQRQNRPNMFVYEDAPEPDMDLLCNKVIDWDEASKC